MATDLKQQIFLAADNVNFPARGFELARALAKAYNKQICLLGIPFSKKTDLSSYKEVFSNWIDEHESDADGLSVNYHILNPGEDFTEFIESTEASMLIFQLQMSGLYNHIQPVLDLCRSLRVPYFFVRDEHKISFERILVPVGRLMEEREKGPFSSSFGRFFDAEILLMPAKDYGSRARQNTDAIRTLIEKSDIKYEEIPATKDSDGVEKEAMILADSLNAGLLMISASRDYGLDDIIFGPKERKIIRDSRVPVMVINPRGDLYALCG